MWIFTPNSILLLTLPDFYFCNCNWDCQFDAVLPQITWVIESAMPTEGTSMNFYITTVQTIKLTKLRSVRMLLAIDDEKLKLTWHFCFLKNWCIKNLPQTHFRWATFLRKPPEKAKACQIWMKTIFILMNFPKVYR